MAPLPTALTAPVAALARAGTGALWRLRRPRPAPSTSAAVGVSAGLARRLDEVLRGRGDAFCQQSPTTCGSSSIAMFRVLTDRGFADALLDGPRDEVAQRWAVLERSVQASTNRAARSGTGGGLRLPWPIALGTPPWGLRDALDDLGRARSVRFRVLRVDGADPVDVEQALGRLRATVAHGIPVPLYVGNGLLPRHVVLAVAAGPSWIDLYDPGTGRRQRVERVALCEQRARISGWDRLWAVIVPR